MRKLMDIEKEIQWLKERNRKVEGDKAWETSKTRKALLMVFTYIAIALYLNVISVPNPWVNAVVPAIGFVLSTLTLPYFKKIWLQYFYRS